MSQIITTYFFKVGNCTMSSKAPDKETALLYVQRMWRTSKIEYVGEEFSHVVEPRSEVRVSPKVRGGNKSLVGQKTIAPVHLSVEERLGRTLVESFGG